MKLTKLARTRGPESWAAWDVARLALADKYRHAPGLGWLAWDGKRWAEGPTAEASAHNAVRIFAEKAQAKIATEGASIRDLCSEVAIPLLQLTDNTLTESDAKTLSLDLKETLKAIALAVPSRVPKDQFDGLSALVKQAEDAREQAEIWLNLLSAVSLGALTKLASRMDGVLTDHRDLDVDKDLIGMDNGVVDMRTGSIVPHDPKLLMTKLARGEFRPGFKDPRWEKALSAVHPEILDWFQIRLGQAATGHRPDDDAMFVCFGGGANGKSTVLNAVRHALGDYAGLIPHKALLLGNNEHSTELTAFRGLRLALMEETPEDGHLDMHRVKVTIGSPTITARRIRENDIEFETTHTMFINTNHKPQISGADEATWRRLLSVPWPYTFVGPGRDKLDEWYLDGDRTLRPDVVDHPSKHTASAIITWVVEGAMKWYAAGRVSPPHPQVVLDSSRDWRMDSDMATRFAVDNLAGDDRYFLTHTDMRFLFELFATDLGLKPWTSRLLTERLTEALRAMGIKLTATPDKTVKLRGGDKQSTVGGDKRDPSLKAGKVVRVWRGVRVRTDVDDRREKIESGSLQAVADLAPPF